MSGLERIRAGEAILGAQALLYQAAPGAGRAEGLGVPRATGRFQPSGTALLAKHLKTIEAWF